MESDISDAHKIESFPSGVRTTQCLESNEFGWSEWISKLNPDVPSVRSALTFNPQWTHANDTTDGKDRA